MTISVKKLNIDLFRIIVKFGFALMIMLLTFMQSTVQAYAGTPLSPEVPYVSYIYKLDGDPIGIPAPYSPVRAYIGADFGLSPFSSLSDIYYDNGSGKFYVCDSGNNRIVILGKDLKFEGSLETFIHNNIRENLTLPGSVAVKNGIMYIADTGMSRIVVIALEDIKPLDEGKTVLRSPRVKVVFDKPEIDILGMDYSYSPNKLEVDYAGRIYVIAAGINQGLIQLEENGKFMGFLGAPRVAPKAIDVIWRKFYTDEQKKRVFKFVPTEYNSVRIDDKGFLYVSSQTVSIPPISRLNSQGENILKSKNITVTGGSSYPDGDGTYTDISGKAVKNYFLDVEPKPNGVYMGLDSNNGKIFAYDRDGLLLYAFGGIGAQIGTFYSPSAMAVVDDRIIVTDFAKSTITEFQITLFGQTVEQAMDSHRSGNYPLSEQKWNEVLDMAASYETADIGLARIEIQDKNYEDALERLEPIGERYYYSLAYREYRSVFMKKNFTWFFLGAALLIAAAVILPKLVRKSPYYRKLAVQPLYKEFGYGKHVIYHPFDGFWDLKREKKGSMWAAGIYYGLFLVVYAVRAQFSGYVVTGIRSEDVNVLYELALIAIPIALFIVSNWCFTTLMDGEGSMKDIFIATGYSLRPYIMLSVPLLAMSHFLVGEEIAFYTVLNVIASGWTIALLVLGMMVTHDYSFSKNILATILTVIGILLMIFIGLLLVNIIQDVVRFVSDIYSEISFRTY